MGNPETERPILVCWCFSGDSYLTHRIICFIVIEILSSEPVVGRYENLPTCLWLGSSPV